MKTYLELLNKVLTQGIESEDRTGVGTLSLFGEQVRYDLSEGFPLLTTKRIHTPAVVHELIWMLRGESNIEYLQKNGVRIWNEWATFRGYLGPMYPTLWRSWPATFHGWGEDFSEDIDQIKTLIEQIKTNPNSRRLVVTAWNPEFLPDSNESPQENAENGKAALAACHCLFQFYVRNNKLSCQLYQRSGDIFLGVPFNITSYALLTHMIAQVCGLEVGEFIHTFGDIHLYKNHVDQAKIQLSRNPRQLPKLKLTKKTNIDDFVYEDVEFIGYTPHPTIKAEVAV